LRKRPIHVRNDMGWKIIRSFSSFFCKRALFFRKRALFFRKRAIFFRRLLPSSAKSPNFPAKEPNYLASSLFLVQKNPIFVCGSFEETYPSANEPYSFVGPYSFPQNSPILVYGSVRRFPSRFVGELFKLILPQKSPILSQALNLSTNTNRGIHKNDYD